jgi:hypothetical protein
MRLAHNKYDIRKFEILLTIFVTTADQASIFIVAAIVSPPAKEIAEIQSLLVSKAV